MIGEDAGKAGTALVSFLEAFARLIAQELRQQLGTHECVG
jgi:hypothetical protein